MRMRPLGNTGLMVSEVGFGGIPLTRVPLDQAPQMVRDCFDLGFRFFDTANLYGDSEVKLGLGLAGIRQEVVLATKTLARDAAGARRHLESSLDKLATDHLDIYQLHNLSTLEDLERVLAPDGAYAALLQVQKEGLVGHLGFSSHHPEVAVKACRTGKFATVQFACNFLEYKPCQPVLETAAQLGMGVIGMKPLGGGLLERADLCFGFLQGVEQVVPIPGIQSLEEAREIVDLYERRPPLGQGQRQQMAAIADELGERFCRRCGYCMPCEEGVQIPSVLMVKSQARRFPPQQARELAAKAMASAEACVACGQCTERCPYSLPIAEMIEECRQLYRAL